MNHYTKQYIKSTLNELTVKVLLDHSKLSNGVDADYATFSKIPFVTRIFSTNEKGMK